MKILTKIALLFASIGLVASGCAGTDSKSSVDLLQYVPADTPYVLAATKPVPDDVADKFEAMMDELLSAYREVGQAFVDAEFNKEGNEETREWSQGLIDEILSLMSIEGLKSAGIGRDAAFVLYGNGLTPVMRFELSDTELFEAAIARIESKAGKQMSVAELQGESYRFAGDEKMRLVLATIDNQVVVTLVPTAFNDVQLSVALGLEKPKSNLGDADTLADINSEYGFEEYLTAFIDIRRIADTLTGNVVGQDADVIAAFGHDLPEISDVCRSEIMQMAGIAPRILMGYNSLSVESADSSFIVELRKDIATGLATIPAPVPGLGQDSDSLFSIGFSLNPLAARDFLLARLDAIEADPYECKMFADIQGGVDDIRAGLNQPLPPVVYNLRGFVADIVAVDGMDIGAGQPPETVDGGILFAMEDAQSLIMMGSMMVPELADLDLKPDGQPVRLTMAAITEYAKDAFAALSEDAVSIAFGSGAEARSADMLTAKSSTVPPFMSMHMDAARYYEIIGEVMAAAPAENDDGEHMSIAVQKAMQKAMLVGGDVYERMSGHVLFTERGIEIVGTATFAD